MNKIEIAKLYNRNAISFIIYLFNTAFKFDTYFNKKRKFKIYKYDKQDLKFYKEIEYFTEIWFIGFIKN